MIVPGLESTKINDLNEYVLRQLADAVRNKKKIKDVEGTISSTPIEKSLIIIRNLLNELITTYTIHKTQPPSNVLALILKSIEVLPLPFENEKLNDYLDMSTSIQLNNLGFGEIIQAQNKPIVILKDLNWINFTKWACDIFPLAVKVPTLKLPRFTKTHIDSLSRGLCLAVLENKMLTASRILRWLPFLKSTSSTKIMITTFNHLEEIENQTSAVTFNLSVIRHYLHEHS